MADFQVAIATVLKHEGRFYADPRGGATDYGVSLGFLKILPDSDGDGYSDGDLNRDGVVCAEDIRALTLGHALALYERFFWDKYRYGSIPEQKLATKILDLSVNMGPRQAHLVVQRALKYNAPWILTDGILGPNSRKLLNKIPAEYTMTEIRHEAAKFYRSLNDPEHEQGWLRRAYA